MCSCSAGFRRFVRGCGRGYFYAHSYENKHYKFNTLKLTHYSQPNSQPNAYLSFLFSIKLTSKHSTPYTNPFTLRSSIKQAGTCDLLTSVIGSSPGMPCAVREPKSKEGSRMDTSGTRGWNFKGIERGF